MLFWIIAAIMTTVATLALLRPLVRSRLQSRPAAPASHDVEVYRDQLSEIDQDLAAGLIEPAQADIAKAEVSRRLLVAARQSEEQKQVARGSGGTARRAAVGVMLAFIPAAAIMSYLFLGSPGAPQQPLAARLAAEPDPSDISVLITRAERHLAENPQDGRGWDVLGPIYLRTGRVNDAVRAFNKAITILGPTSRRQAGLGEALVSAAGGVVTEEARLVFQSARELDPEDPRPIFFLALALAQEGRRDEAVAAFSALSARSPADAPWQEAVRRQIATLSQQGNAGAPALAPGNPTQSDIEAAAGMTPEQRQEMVRGMVSALAERLRENPDDIEGWKRLIRSEMVLGNMVAAQRALATAFSTFPDDGPEEKSLAVLAKELGLQFNPTLGGVMLPKAVQPGKDAQAAPPAPFIVPGGSSAPGNPTQSDIAAAAAMAPAERMEMIRNMVATLDAKLAEDPGNIEGWLRLVRSYTVLGDRESARAAVKRAHVAFAADSAEAGALNRLAAELGLEN